MINKCSQYSYNTNFIYKVVTVPAYYVRTSVTRKRIYQTYVRERYAFAKRKRISPERLKCFRRRGKVYRLQT